MTSVQPSNNDYLNQPLEHIITDMNLVEELQIREIMASNQGERLDHMLLEKKLITEEDLLKVFHYQLGLPLINEIDNRAITDELVSNIPINFAKKHKLLPMRDNQDGTFDIACSDPYALGAFDELAHHLNGTLNLHLVGSEILLKTINSVYDRRTKQAEEAMESLADEDLDSFAHDLEETQDLLDAEDEAPIIRLVNSLMSQSVKEHASDIHIEPFESTLVVRFRIDGVLHEKIQPPKKLHASIVSRIKIMAGLNIAEKRLPQDGRIRIKIAGRDIDIRVATAPTSYGERITMRLLDRSSILLDLSDLGFSPENLKNINSLIKRPHGIILVTGPTGSGKTTTLYACLSKINTPDKNILTVEDPVEYQLKGISQTQVNPKIDLTFASGLRSFLRHDPDVIMVGEIRDLETAEIAIQASLTGHLVLSTIHTNDSAGAITRLVDMGVEPFLVASSIIGILAQRLVRTICPHCKTAYTPTDAELKELGIESSGTKPNCYKGAGCNECFGTGYMGRSGIYELMMMDDDVRKLVLQNVDNNSIKRSAAGRSMLTLREDGARKVLAGITTSAEVMRVTQEDEF